MRLVLLVERETPTRQAEVHSGKACISFVPEFRLYGREAWGIKYLRGKYLGQLLVLFLPPDHPLQVVRVI